MSAMSKQRAGPARRTDRAPGARRRTPPETLQLAGAVALLAAMAQGSETADRVRDHWFRANRRFLPERSAIAGLADLVLRHRAALDWWVRKLTPDLAPDATTRLLAALALTGRRKPGTIARAWPAPLEPAQARLLGLLEGRTLNHPDMPLAVQAGIPDWLLPDLTRQYGEGLAAEMLALVQPAPVDLRVNRLKATPEGARAALGAEGLTAKPTPFSPIGLRLPPQADAGATRALAEGLVEVQDEGSQLAAALVEAQPGQFVVDFCAGAGGKTLALAADMANRGRLVALDVSAGRLQRAKVRLRRAGAHNVECRKTDAKWLKRHAGGADRVLADMPCSGTGTWRRKPDARWRLKPGDIPELLELQRSLMDQAARLVRPGGRLIYVTCSLLRAENEDQIDAFLARRTDFALLPVGDVWSRRFGSAAPTREAWLRLSPARHGADGFFVAVLQRADGG